MLSLWQNKLLNELIHLSKMKKIEYNWLLYITVFIILVFECPLNGSLLIQINTKTRLNVYSKSISGYFRTS